MLAIVVENRLQLAQGSLQAQLGSPAKTRDQHHEIAQQAPVRTQGGSSLPQRLAGRQAKAYPVYDENYEDRISLFREWLDGDMPGLHLIGRNGMHKYNNQDHAMLTAMTAVETSRAPKRAAFFWP